ncbi:MAG: hypothetical protein ACOCWQ_01655 [Nanoarchaeota archaeon]
MGQLSASQLFSLPLLVILLALGFMLLRGTSAVSCEDAFLAGRQCVDCMFDPPLGKCLERESKGAGKVHFILVNRLPTEVELIQAQATMMHNGSRVPCDLRADVAGVRRDLTQHDPVTWSSSMIAEFILECPHPEEGRKVDIDLRYRQQGMDYGIHGALYLETGQESSTPHGG